MAAARHGNDAMIRQLLDAGARALTRSERGETAGDIAVSQKHEGARALLLRAEEGEYSPLAEHLMDERIALETLRRLALTAQRRRAEELQGDQGVARTGRGQASALLARIAASASGMLTGWRRQTEPRAVFAWSLTRSAKALEWAIHVRDLDLVRAVAEDLETKRRDCDARPERRFGAVKISIRTLADNVERQGLQVRFMEGFFFNLLPRRPDLASQWREFPRVSAIVDEPLPAGEYAIVAWAGGKPIGEPKSISVGINKSTRFDIVVP
jgi:hypothetical protein